MLRQLEECQNQLQDQKSVSHCETHETPKLTPGKEKLLFSKIDLSGAENWDHELIEEAKQLF